MSQHIGDVALKHGAVMVGSFSGPRGQAAAQITFSWRPGEDHGYLQLTEAQARELMRLLERVFSPPPGSDTVVRCPAYGDGGCQYPVPRGLAPVSGQHCIGSSCVARKRWPR